MSLQVMAKLRHFEFTIACADVVSDELYECMASGILKEHRSEFFFLISTLIRIGMTKLFEYMNIIREIELRCNLLQYNVMPTDIVQDFIDTLRTIRNEANLIASDCKQITFFIRDFKTYETMNCERIIGIVPRYDYKMPRSGEQIEDLADLYEKWRDVSWIIELCKVITTLRTMEKELIKTLW